MRGHDAWKTTEAADPYTDPRDHDPETIRRVCERAKERRLRSEAYRRCAALIRNVGPPSAAFLADTIETWAAGGQ